MSVLSLFMQTGLGPKTLAAMARAYDDLLRELRITGRTDQTHQGSPGRRA